MRGLLVVLACVCAVALTVPVPQDEAEAARMKDTFNAAVPCPFCNATIPLLMQVCKANGGRSLDHVEDFYTMCGELGGLNPTNKASLLSDCTETEWQNDRVNVIFRRRLRCKKIFHALSEMYSPFDPCVQIRADYQHHPMSVCRSAMIDCHDPDADLSAIKHNASMVPPYDVQTDFFQPPPLSCVEYVSGFVSECEKLKKEDFYARSSLDGWCAQVYNGTYQVSACETVLGKMKQVDSLMDLCSGMKVLPLKESHQSFCNNTLSLPANHTVPDHAYTTYMASLRTKLKEDSYRRVLKATPAMAKGEVIPLP